LLPPTSGARLDPIAGDDGIHGDSAMTFAAMREFAAQTTDRRYFVPLPHLPTHDDPAARRFGEPDDFAIAPVRRPVATISVLHLAISKL
jgi:hypothetical protein